MLLKCLFIFNYVKDSVEHYLFVRFISLCVGGFFVKPVAIQLKLADFYRKIWT